MYYYIKITNNRSLASSHDNHATNAPQAASLPLDSLARLFTLLCSYHGRKWRAAASHHRREESRTTKPKLALERSRGYTIWAMWLATLRAKVDRSPEAEALLTRRRLITAWSRLFRIIFSLWIICLFFVFSIVLLVLELKILLSVGF